MPLFKDTFHWNVLLRWDVFAALVGLGLTVGGLVLVFDQYLIANICFVAVSLLVFSKVIHLAINETRDKWWERMTFTFLMFGLFGVVIVETVVGVNAFAAHKKAREEAAKNKDVPAIIIPDKKPDPAPSPSVLSGTSGQEQRIAPPHTDKVKHTPASKEVVAISAPWPEDLNDKDLAKAAATLSTKIRDWAKDVRARSQIQSEERSQRIQNMSPEQRSEEFKNAGMRAMKEMQDTQDEYDKTFRADALALRKELLSRLPRTVRYDTEIVMHQGYYDTSMQGNLFITDKLADDLEMLANKLHSPHN